jgi:hypothetical protein
MPWPKVLLVGALAVACAGVVDALRADPPWSLGGHAAAAVAGR